MSVKLVLEEVEKVVSSRKTKKPVKERMDSEDADFSLAACEAFRKPINRVPVLRSTPVKKLTPPQDMNDEKEPSFKPETIDDELLIGYQVKNNSKLLGWATKPKSKPDNNSQNTECSDKLDDSFTTVQTQLPVDESQKDFSQILTN